ncbi:O-antigen polymerase [Carnobacterium gallinarum]|uniref:O-antigen polymerase n=1 Tax=Carnobacterium gallinarum TaxID=2749 RepID=UPI0005553230|nr:O-antigen polymerase [Carnobacterium gallinarum]
MVNPYYIYSVSFIGVIIAYLLGWSNLFPELRFSLILFMGFSIGIALLFGNSIRKRKIIVFENLTYTKIFQNTTLFIMGGYLLEGLYNGSFPLIDIMLGKNSNYTEFGIPTFHVFLVTFNSFFAVYLFQALISEGNFAEKKKLFMFFSLNLLPGLLIVNRGMLVIILMSCFFVYTIKFQNKMTIKKASLLMVILFIGAFLFGVAGNVRVNSSYQTGKSSFNNDTFLNIGKASDSFKNSIIPKEFFWTYIYVASPLANFQETIEKQTFDSDITVSDTAVFFVTQIMPDFISKRIVSEFEIETQDFKKITPELNVGTAFIASYVILGWPGVILFITILFLFAYFYLLFLRSLGQKYFITGVAILNTLFLMNTFSNMLSFTGISFQLIYPIIFGLVDKYKELQYHNREKLKI